MNLKEKLSLYKAENLVFNKDLIDFFKNFDVIVEEIEREYTRLDDILEVGKVNYSEFESLKTIITNFKNYFEKLEKLFKRNEDKIEIFKEIRDNSTGIIEEFKIVKDLETCRWGDYVFDVKKDTLCSVNSQKLELLLDCFAKISSYTENKVDYEELPNTCNLFIILANLLGKFESEFVLNVVYRHPTESMRDLIEISKNIDHKYNYYKRSKYKGYFKSSIENSFITIESLESKFRVAANRLENQDKIVKLKDIIGPKRIASSLFDFRDSLKYSFEFSEVKI